MSEGQEDGAWKELNKSGFVELVNLDFGKYKNVSHYGFNVVCKEKQYDWVCYMVTFATVYKGNIIKNLIMDCQSYTKYRPNETTGGIFVSWRRKEELPTGA